MMTSAQHVEMRCLMLIHNARKDFMKKTVTVRNMTLGEGMPKICVPMIGKNKAEYLQELEAMKSLAVDIVEWRMDWFEGVQDHNAVIETLKFLREQLQELPILATFRSKKEGGEKEISAEAYVALNNAVSACGYADMIDVELFTGIKEVKEMVAMAHKHNVKVVMSNHDFFKTPSYDEIIARLTTMQQYGADVPKIAVMPCNNTDVLTLLKATNDMVEQHADRPIITMSMAGTGVLSRLCGEVFGSALTFGAAKKASAPGQIPVNELKAVLEVLHKSM